MEPYNPTDHTVAEVNEYLAQADDSERERVLEAEAQREGGGRSTIDGLTDHLVAVAAKANEPAEDTGAEEEQEEGEAKETTTKAATFSEAAKAATPDSVGYLGTSPERERTGLADKGLSQASVLKRGNKPGPDPRQGVDDSSALKG